MKTLMTFLLILMASMMTYPSKAVEYAVIATDAIEWGLLNPLRGDASPRAANLWGDRSQNMATGMLVKFNKGFSSPPHIHNVSYRGVVIKGQIHNDDPGAEKMWLPPGSFWTQPAGESHITAAQGQENLIYLEIDSGPYLVLSEDKAFDNGERPVNMDARNLVWLGAQDIQWLSKDTVHIAYLWGTPRLSNGSFVKLSAGFKGKLVNNKGLKAVVVKGQAIHQWNANKTRTPLSPGSFFRSDTKGQHHLHVKAPLLLYVHSNGRYTIE